MDVGGRVVELAETEFMVRGRGYIRGIADLEEIVLKAQGAPVRLKDVARVELAPDERRGLTELNGEGEVVSGIAVRFGQNALSVIGNVKASLDEIKGSLPEGTEIVPVYDRSDLSRHRHAAADADRREPDRGARLHRVPAARAQRLRRDHHAAAGHPDRLPLHVLLGLSSNIMSLGGIAIAIGAMVDAAIVMIENAHKHLERALRTSRAPRS